MAVIPCGIYLLATQVIFHSWYQRDSVLSLAMCFNIWITERHVTGLHGTFTRGQIKKYAVNAEHFLII